MDSDISYRSKPGTEMKIVASEISGSLKAPPSKSMMIRAVVAGLLSKGRTLLRNPSRCDDALAAMQVSRGLGANIEDIDDDIHIQGGDKLIKTTLNCQESGLSIRMFSALAALHNMEITLDGTGSLIDRPVNMLVNPLEELGVRVTTNNGYLPIQIKGPLKGGAVKVDGSQSSQFLTGLLMSLPLVDENSRIFVDSLKSKPYIDMTMRIMEDFGVKIKHTDYKSFAIEGNQKYKAQEYSVEGDWSGAAFLLVAGAIGGEVEVINLDAKSKQADIQILKALQLAGANLEIRENSVKVSKGKLTSFSLDITDCPDLAPPLVVLSSYCKGKSRFTGVERLFIKESNRAKTLQEEFAKLGIEILIQDNEMIVEGGKIHGGSIYSHDDHRIAMAGATAAVGATGPVIIEGADCVSKSWPDFFVDLKNIGGIVYE